MVTPADVAKAPVTKQVGFIIKGGGLDIDAWAKIEKEKNPGILVVDFPTHVEFHIEEKKK